MSLSNPTNLTSGGNSTTSTSDTTASFSPTGDGLILAWVDTLKSGGFTTGISISDSFGGLSWTQYDPGGIGLLRISLFVAKAPASPGSGTVTFTYNESLNRKCWGVDETTGQDVSEVSENKMTTSDDSNSTLSLTMTDFATGNLFYGKIGTRAVSGDTVTPGTNETEIVEVQSTGGSRTMGQSEYGTDTTVDWSGLPTSQENAAVGIEIVVAAAEEGQPRKIRDYGIPTTSPMGIWN